MNKKNRNVYSFLGYYGNENIGDELLLSNVMEYIFKKDSNALFKIYGSSTIGFENLNFPNKVFVQRRNLKNPVNFLKVVVEILKSNYLIYSGGQIFSNQNIYINSALIFLAGIFKVKVIIFPVGVSPILKKNWLIKILWKNVDYLSVRDIPSYNNLSWSNKVDIKPDVAFLPKPIEIKMKDGIETIGFNPRVINDQTNEFLLNYFISIAKGLENTCLYLIYSTSTGQKNDQDDEFICKELSNRLLKAGFNSEFIELRNVEDLRSFLPRLDLNIACRLHSFLESLVLGVPTFTIKLKEIPKVQSIIEFLDLKELMLIPTQEVQVENFKNLDYKNISYRILNHHKNILSTIENVLH